MLSDNFLTWLSLKTWKKKTEVKEVTNIIEKITLVPKITNFNPSGHLIFNRSFSQMNHKKMKKKKKGSEVNKSLGLNILRQTLDLMAFADS